MAGLAAKVSVKVAVFCVCLDEVETIRSLVPVFTACTHTHTHTHTHTRIYIACTYTPMHARITLSLIHI